MWISTEFLFDEHKNHGVCIEHMHIIILDIEVQMPNEWNTFNLKKSFLNSST